MNSENYQADIMKPSKICINVDSQIFEKYKQTVNTRHITNKHILCHIKKAIKIWIEKQQIITSN